jgi:uncharacterized protein YjdB
MFLVPILSACIGTDEVDDPIVGESIELDREQVALLVGDSTIVEATYFNQYGVEEDVQLLWSSSNEAVATVDLAGLLIGQGAGQANIAASYGSSESLPILVTVVESEVEVANVSLTSPQGNQISVGQEVQLEVVVSNLNGDVLLGLPVSFTALDPEYLTVDEGGKITGISNGLGRVVAEVVGVESNTLNIQVGTTSRAGTFSGANGYDASGSTELFIAENGALMLRLGNDFSTDFALGTYIYLSNSTSGSVTRNEGLEIQEVTSGGSHLFNVSDVDSSVSIDAFEYVIVLCKPAAITFGIAELTP